LDFLSYPNLRVIYKRVLREAALAVMDIMLEVHESRGY